jgi:hypothetical protein
MLQDGGALFVLFGGGTPYCLRKVEDHYILIGECYVYGLMNGEAMVLIQNGELEKRSLETT